MPRETLDFLEDTNKAARSIAFFIDGMSNEDFASDEKTVYAVIHAFEIIGEAAKQVPDDIRTRYPRQDWASMAKMRDLLIHHYFGTQYSIIWETIEKRIPPLLEEIPGIIKDMK